MRVALLSCVICIIAVDWCINLSRQDENPQTPSHAHRTRHLVEGVGAGSPVGEEHAEADGLEDAGDGTDSNGVERTLLSEDLGDDLKIVNSCSCIKKWRDR
jgi:hypothetical protein